LWTPDHRRAANRSGLRYPNDLTDAERAIVESMIPPERPGGREHSVNVREVLNGIYMSVRLSRRFTSCSLLGSGA
jgi:transposase